MRNLNLLILSTLFVTILSGCVPREFIPYRTAHQIVVVADEAKLYERDPVYPNRIGRIAGTHAGYGDTITCLGEIRGRMGMYYAVVVTGTPYWMRHGEVITLRDYAVLIQSLSFRLHNSQDPVTWNRAAVFIARYSPWSIAVEGDYVISTRNFGRLLETEMTVSRMAVGDSVEYRVTPSRYIGDNVPRLHIAKELAYFMKTGKERQMN